MIGAYRRWYARQPEWKKCASVSIGAAVYVLMVQIAGQLLLFVFQ